MRTLRWSTSSGIAEEYPAGCAKWPSSVEPLSDARTPLADFFRILLDRPADAKHHWKGLPEQYRKSDTLAEMGATAASQTSIRIVADQEEEKIQQALAAGTFRIP